MDSESVSILEFEEKWLKTNTFIFKCYKDKYYVNV